MKPSQCTSQCLVTDGSFLWKHRRAELLSGSGWIVEAFFEEWGSEGLFLLAKSLDLDFLKVPGQQPKCDVYQQERLQHRHHRESLVPGESVMKTRRSWCGYDVPM